MNTIRVQARLLLGALLTAVLIVTVVPASTSAPSASASTEARAAAPATAPVSAKEARRRCTTQCYGAIAVNWRTGGAFSYVNMATKARAKGAVKQYCINHSRPFAGQCQVVGWARNWCMAVAFKRNQETGRITSRVGFGAANQLWRAKQLARQHSGGKGVKLSACNAN